MARDDQNASAGDGDGDMAMAWLGMDGWMDGYEGRPTYYSVLHRNHVNSHVSGLSAALPSKACWRMPCPIVGV